MLNCENFEWFILSVICRNGVLLYVGLLYMYIYKYNYIDVVVRKIFCEFEDKNFYVNFDVYVGNIYNLIFN